MRLDTPVAQIDQTSFMCNLSGVEPDHKACQVDGAREVGGLSPIIRQSL